MGVSEGLEVWGGDEDDVGECGGVKRNEGWAEGEECLLDSY